MTLKLSSVSLSLAALGAVGISELRNAQSQTGIICDVTHYRYNICFVNGLTLLDPTSLTFFLLPPHHHSATTSGDGADSTGGNSSAPFTQKLRTYPRKWEHQIMAKITELTVTTGTPRNATCDVVHDEAALVFSSGGYTGNLYHEFNDGMIPLFVTSRLLAGRSAVLVISEFRRWWAHKYAAVLRHHSRHPPIKLDDLTSTHCFRGGAVVGIASHGDMTINPALMPNGETMLSFRAFLGESYRAGENRVAELGSESARPVLVMVVRNGSRSVTNQAEVTALAERIGFLVKTFQPTRYTDLNEAYRVINASHAMMGVHGAGLTHFMFLRPGSVLVQVIPLGTGWVSETCFGRPAREMGLKYVPYQIDVEESSLVERYDRNDPVLKDPDSVVRRGWMNTKNVYLKNQTVTLDTGRLSRYLKLAYRKARRFMAKSDRKEGSYVEKLYLRKLS